MPLIHRLPLSVVLIVLVLAACGGGDRPAPAPAADAIAPVRSHGTVDLTWESDWETALARAEAENRPLLVTFSAEWCIWCRRLESTTFVDREVQARLAELVLLELEIDRGGRERARALGVDAPPTLVVLSPRGEELGRILGYMPPTTFLERLTAILPEP